MAINTEYIWDNFHNDLFKFINRRINDNEISKDILQDVFIKIHLKINTLSNKDKLTNWIYQITRNSILDFLKKHRPTADEIDFFSDNEAEEESFNLEMSACMLNLINKLPEIYKDALLKTELGKLTQKEYAQILGLSYSGAKTRVQRARSELHELFKHCCTIQADIYGNIIDFEKLSIRDNK